MSKQISIKLWDSALFNLDSMRMKLMNERDDSNIEGKSGEYLDKLQEKIDEIEDLLTKMYFGKVTKSDWNRIQQIVKERQWMRYCHCLNSGMDERDAAGAFQD